MFQFNSNKIAKFITATLVLAGFFAIVIFQWNSIETIYHFRTQTPQCPSSEAQTGCSTFTEHVNFANSFFTATLPNFTNILEVLLLLVLGVLISGNIFKSIAPNRRDGPTSFYVRDNPDLPLFNHLRLAFARGILNPKIY